MTVAAMMTLSSVIARRLSRARRMATMATNTTGTTCAAVVSVELGLTLIAPPALPMIVVQIGC